MRFASRIRPSAAGSTVIASERDWGWFSSFPREWRLGQSRRALSPPGAEFWDPRGKRTAEEQVRQMISEATEAVMKFPSDQLGYIQASVTSVNKLGPKNCVVRYSNNYLQPCERVVICSGVGPEKDLTASGVKFLNSPTGPRVLLYEATTALKAMEQGSKWFAGKRLAIYGGGATAAWMGEAAFLWGGEVGAWLSPNGFAGANPGGRNNDIMDWTEHVRHEGKINMITFEGDTAYGRGLLANVQLGRAKTKADWNFDAIIAATGADPLAPTGIQSVLGLGYQSLKPIHLGNPAGLIAVDDDGTIIVTSPALAADPTWSGDFGPVFANLETENQIAAGIRVTELSAEAAANYFESTR